MSDTILVALIGILTIAVGTGLTQWGIQWVTKKRYPLDEATAKANEIVAKANAKLAEGGAAEKFEAMLTRAADRNIELEEKNTKEKAEFDIMVNQLKTQVDDLKKEMERQKLESTARFEQNEKENAARFEELQCENEKWKNWAMRLAMQVKSLDAIPVPFDPKKARNDALNNVGGGISLDYDPHNQE